jgi:hypothetical protein
MGTHWAYVWSGLQMKNLELECVPEWRYCRIPYAEKGPRYAGWQNTPLALRDIPEGMNVGLLLGPPSGGIVALDFDGLGAWDYFAQTFGISVPETVSWASGRPGRCQMAFRVEESYWPYLETKKVVLDCHEGFEIRWNRAQSVLPPSRHPDLGTDYFWVLPPSITDILPLPEAVLTWWLQESNPEPVAVTVEHPPVTEAEVLADAALLKQLYPTLEYDTWCRVTWAFCNTIGYEDGIALMQYHWPEMRRGEYARLRSKPPERRCTIGTVKRMIRDRRPPKSVMLARTMMEKLRNDEYAGNK